MKDNALSMNSSSIEVVADSCAFHWMLPYLDGNDSIDDAACVSRSHIMNVIARDWCSRSWKV